VKKTIDLKTLKAEARKKLNGYCRVCPVCDGRVCAGEVPGMGGAGTGASFMENVKALSAIKINLSAIHDTISPDTTTSFFGQHLETPIMAAPMVNYQMNTGGGLTERDAAEAITTGSHLAGSLAWIGDPVDTEMYCAWLEAMNKVGRGVAIIKPRLNNDDILELFAKAQQNGAFAVGVDVDGAGLITMKLKGQPVGPKTREQLMELTQSTKLPFIVKGIMTVQDAVKCAEAGANAIVISNHGGRVLDHTCGTADTLPAIAKELKGRVTILVDGGIRSGVDTLKMLALGADGVLIGRPLVVGAYGGNAEGVKSLINKYTEELYAAMILTGCANLQQIDSRILFEKF
jgi:4-hydroxymandelate oxidase